MINDLTMLTIIKSYAHIGTTILCMVLGLVIAHWCDVNVFDN